MTISPLHPNRDDETPPLPTPEEAARQLKQAALELNLRIRMAAALGLRVDVEVGEHYTSREFKIGAPGGHPTPEVTVRVAREL